MSFGRGTLAVSNKNKNSLCIVICTSIAENSEKVVPCKYVVLLFLFDPKN